jgi:hypothetical protein
LPIGGAIDDLAHALEPPLSTTLPPLAARCELTSRSETHFQLAIQHIYPFFCGQIVREALGQILSK